MEHTLRDNLIGGLRGANSHMDPRRLIKGLTPDLARQRPPHSFDSCWELIHHMVVWQNAVLHTLKGEKVDWKNVFATDWLKEDQMTIDSDFHELVKKFEAGLDESKELIKTIDLDLVLPFWEEFTAREGIFVILQHNSYHVGQIIAVRRVLGFPPEDYVIPNH